MTTLILPIIAVFTLCLYLAYTIGTFGVPKSLSDTFNLLGGWKGKGWMFWALCLGLIFLLVPAFLDATRENLQPLAFFAVAPLAIVGVAAEFENKMTEKVHYTAAVACFILSQLWVIFEPGYWWLSLGCLASAVIISLIWGNKLFWIEMGGIAAAIAALIIKSIV